MCLVVAVLKILKVGNFRKKFFLGGIGGSSFANFGL
jgi:hypothetical protein